MARLQRQTYYKTYYKTKQENGVKSKYKIVSKMTSSDIKNYIKKANNWTDEQYRKQYDIFKNKLRAYEAYRATQGRAEKQNVIDVLYKEARAKMLHGDAYTPSMKIQQIRSFSAYSITKGRKMAQSAEYQKRQREKYDKYLEDRFGAFVKANKQAQEIAEHYKDNPVKREQALSDFANDLKVKMGEDGRIEESEAVPQSGEAHGYVELDIDDYLTY